MHLNTDPVTLPTVTPPRKPCIRDLAQLTSTLLPEAVVKLTPLEELRRRIGEINVTHPQYQEETPLVLAWEEKRRQVFTGQLQVIHRQEQVA